VAEVEAYFEELAASGIDTGIDVNEELDLADVNTEIEEEVVEPEVVATPGDTKKGVQESDIPEEGILNFNSGIKYLASELQLAIDEASAGDTLVLGSGRYNADVEVTKALSIYGANFNQAINQDENGDAKAGFLDEAGNADASGIKFDFADAQRSDHGESWIDGSITVSADNVTLNGLRLHSYDGALKFADDDIDGFTLKHSYVTGFESAGAIDYVDSYDDDDTNNDGSTGWEISDNLIGGVAGGVGGSLYLDGLADSEISGNIFWRPGAAHVYADNLSGVEFSGNFFYHGLHAGGANFDDNLADLRGSDENYGYVGFNGGRDGYGYGFGYGFDANSSDLSPAGYGGYAGGYGLAGYGEDDGGWDGFYGRNYWIELKGDQTDVSFIGNVGQFNSGGIQFWDEGIAENVFTNISIVGNTFQDFINADPGGNLVDAGTRHKSGLVSGIVWETTAANTSSNVYIAENIISGSIDEIYNYNPSNPSDLTSLIDIKGGLTNLVIDANSLSWTGNLPTGSTANVAPVETQGIHLAGEIQDFIFIVGNDFATADVSSDYASVALAINAVDFGDNSFGELSSDNFVLSEDLVWTAFTDQLAASGATSEEMSALFGGDGTPKHGFYVVVDEPSSDFVNYEYLESVYNPIMADGMDAGDYVSYYISDDVTAFSGDSFVQIGLFVDDVEPEASSLGINTDTGVDGADNITNDTKP